MKFALNIAIQDQEQAVYLGDLVKNLESAKKLFADLDNVSAAIIPVINGKPGLEPYFDPMLPLMEQWLLKLPWILSGDTETIPLRNSEHIFGFEAVSEAVYLSVYLGDESEVETYVLEPVAIPAEYFCETSILASKQLVQLIELANPQGSAQNADMLTLKSALNDAEKALRDYKLRK